MKKTNSERKLNLNKKVIIMLNGSHSARLLGGTVNDVTITCTGLSRDPGVCTKSTAIGATCPSNECTTGATGTCRRGV
jgi:hypothetical protein